MLTFPQVKPRGAVDEAYQFELQVRRDKLEAIENAQRAARDANANANALVADYVSTYATLKLGELASGKRSRSGAACWFRIDSRSGSFTNTGAERVLLISYEGRALNKDDQPGAVAAYAYERHAVFTRSPSEARS